MAKGFFKTEEEEYHQQMSNLQKEVDRLNQIPSRRPDIRDSDTLLKKWDEVREPPKHVTPCQCDFKKEFIKCPRHKAIKTKHLHTLCQTRLDYFNMWEEGIGPNQDPVMRYNFVNEYPVTDTQVKRREEKWQSEMDGIMATQDNREKNRKEEEEEATKGFFMGDPEIPKESRGLGDTVAKITKATGIKKVVDSVFGAMNKDCGCKERQSKLNKLFPYGKPKKTKGFFE
tara:strand:+ start:2999 stop:3682 length:684 start_codon:yes stop_codon:yes gene_type:complete